MPASWVEPLSLVGAFFILASILCVIGGYYERSKRHLPADTEGLLRALGVAALFIWVVVGFGLASWGISAIVFAPFAGSEWIVKRFHLSGWAIMGIPVAIVVILVWLGGV